MQIQFSIVDIINFFFIATGIGICSLSIRQVTVSVFLRKEIRRYFQIFFLVIILYLVMHLIRQIIDGLLQNGVRGTLYVVTFIELLAAGFMSWLLSLLILEAARTEKHARRIRILLLVILCVHTILLVVSQFTGLMYYFDADNIYHRAPGYLFSNLCPMLMIVINIILLLRCRKNMKRRIASAFWVFTILPIIAAVFQSLIYGIQFIILATVSAAVYMFEVIITDQTEQYEKQQVETARLDSELSMANRIQADMLPNIFPAFPEREEFDIYATMTPAKEVGGDFYDFFLIDQNHLGLVMADVSGKGIPAALFMMISKILVQNYALTGRSPKEVLESVNEQICKNNREEMFVTVWFGVLDLTNGHLTAANAGHEYPALKKPDGSFELIRDKHGIVVGAMEGVKYKEYELLLEPGAKLFLYTDGVAEATNAQDELFGTDRMIDALRKSEDGTTEEVLESVHQSVNAFVKNAPQFDDLTMLVLQYNG